MARGRRGPVAGARRRHARGPRRPARSARRPRAAAPRTRAAARTAGRRRRRRASVTAARSPGCRRSRRATTSPRSCAAAARDLGAGDVLVVAHKVGVEGRGARAARWPTSCPAPGRARWPPSTARTRATSRSCSTSRAEVVRAERGVLICRTHHGFVCANAGVDASNAPATGELVLLPPIPTPRRGGCAAAWPSDRRGARRGHRRLLRAGVAPRPGRRGDRRAPACAPLEDWRGRPDARGPRAARDVDRRRRPGGRGGRPRARQGSAASRPSSSAASSATSRRETGLARRRSCARRRGPLPLIACPIAVRPTGAVGSPRRASSGPCGDPGARHASAAENDRNGHARPG